MLILPHNESQKSIQDNYWFYRFIHYKSNVVDCKTSIFGIACLKSTMKISQIKHIK